MAKKYKHVLGQRIPNVTTIGTIQVKWQNDDFLPKQYHCVCTSCRTGSDRSETEVFEGCPMCLAEVKELKENIEKANASLAAAKALVKSERLAKKAAVIARREARLLQVNHG